MKKQKGFTLIDLLLVVAILVIIVVVLIPSRAKRQQDQLAMQTAEASGMPLALARCNPIDEGAGVWHFPCDGENFAKALAGFRTSHKELRIVSAASSYGEGSTTVVTEPIAVHK